MGPHNYVSGERRLPPQAFEKIPIRIVKKTVAAFLAGLLVGACAAYLLLRGGEPLRFASDQIAPQPAPVCYSCFWQGYDPKFRHELIDFYSQYQSSDPLVMADVRYVVWRASDNPNCDVRAAYRDLAARDPDLYRRLAASAILAFSGPECGQSGTRDMRRASSLAGKAGLKAESVVLDHMTDRGYQPQFGDVNIATSIVVPPSAKTLVLGENALQITPGTRIGTQVDRVGRDWLSYQMRWDLTEKPLPVSAMLDYHEGALVRRIAGFTPVEVYPLFGSVVAQQGGKWYGLDDTGVFRFEILGDKMQYPTTHAAGRYGWIEDTHGISALVPQAIERHAQVVVGCGDSVGKAKAEFYLAQKGINVLFPGDRYEDLLLGYQAPGVLLGTAPVRKIGNNAVIGGQPVKFALSEPIVVEDTKALFPVQYYDAPARYFRRLHQFVPLHLDYVYVDAPNPFGRVLARAGPRRATAVAVRVATEPEYKDLKSWLQASAQHRAILFHSGLYPYAQPLFSEFPQQVTFGDLHPRFE